MQEAWQILGDVEKRARYDWLPISKEFQGQMPTQNSRYNAQLANNKFDSEQDAALAATFKLEDLAEIEDGNIGLQCRYLSLLVTFRVKYLLLTQVWGDVSRRKVRYRGSFDRVWCSSRLWHLLLTDFGCQQMTSARNKQVEFCLVVSRVSSVKEIKKALRANRCYGVTPCYSWREALFKFRSNWFVPRNWNSIWCQLILSCRDHLA